MRIAGLSNLYGITNTRTAQRYHTTRNITRTGQNAYKNTANYKAMAANRIQTIYENTKTSAQNVRSCGHRLMNSGKNGLLVQAAETGNTKEVVTEVKNFVTAYNTMVENMKQTGGSKNQLYTSQLEANYNNHKETLSKVGITMAKDGMLEVNQETLANADVAELKKAFGGTESFVGNAAVKSIYVESEAVSAQTVSWYARYGSYTGYAGYSGYGYYGLGSLYNNYHNYGNYSALGSYLGARSYGSGYSCSNLIGTMFHSLF